MVSLVVLALAVSLDGFIVALILGARRIKFSHLSMAIVAISSGLLTYLVMQSGDWMQIHFSLLQTKKLGAWLFLGIGVYLLVQKSITFNWYQDRMVIQILFSPTKADLDCSGSISLFEALWLGISLSLDAIGAGLAASWLGFLPMWTSLGIALMGLICLQSGSFLGKKFGQLQGIRFLHIFPGCLFIGLGISKLIA